MRGEAERNGGGKAKGVGVVGLDLFPFCFMRRRNIQSGERRKGCAWAAPFPRG